MKKYTSLNDDLFQYLLNVSVREHPVLKVLREKTALMPGAQMQIAPDQGQFFAMLIKLMNAEHVLEIGTFTGYSALAMALALPENGQLVTCDIDDKNIDVAKQHWRKADVSEKINFRLGDARNTLSTLIDEKKLFDFIFIDADKRAYDHYYEQSLNLIKPGGIIALDNVLQEGEVVNIENTKAQVEAIRLLNEKLYADSRVEICMLSIGDGVTLLRYTGSDAKRT